jgi:outer membrane protein OmpA-like peptidoglycan-associated protein
MKIHTTMARSGALGLGLVAYLAAAPAPADEVLVQAHSQAQPLPQGQSKQATAGALSGLVVGAVAGGPIGAVVGLTAGAILGDRYHRQKQTADGLAADLSQSEAERAQLAQHVADMDGTLSAAQAHDALQDKVLQQTNELGIDVAFRTNDDAVSLQALPPLMKLGALAAAMPQAKVHVDGFADPRGVDEYNQALSLRRAQAVAAVLASAGVTPECIVVQGHGDADSTSAAGDLDGYALDRRVSVRLELPGSAQVARRE